MIKIILATIIFIIVMVIVEMINEPKDKKVERIKIANQTIKPITLTHIDGLSGYGKGVKVKFSKNTEEINIDKTYSIPTKNIESTIFNSSKELTEHQKNVIGRSLIGGLLLGPLGAVVGGISGVGTQKETTMIWIITINYKEYGNSKTAIFATEDESIIPRLKNVLNSY